MTTFQPFEKFKPQYIERLVKLKKIYLVSQTYKIGFTFFEEVAKKNILFTDYENIGLAEQHHKAVRHDKYASIINLTKEKHIKIIKSMFDENSNYEVFWAMVSDREKMKQRLDAKYKSNIRRYILNNTNWRIGANESLQTVLEIIYGEFHLTLKRGTQTLRVKFEDIEKA